MKRFEYCFISQVDHYYIDSVYQNLIFSNGKNINLEGKELANVLDDLGKDGWEMIGTGYANYGHNVYFKREIEG